MLKFLGYHGSKDPDGLLAEGPRLEHHRLGQLGRGLYVTPQKEIAAYFAKFHGGRVLEVWIDAYDTMSHFDVRKELHPESTNDLWVKSEDDCPWCTDYDLIEHDLEVWSLYGALMGEQVMVNPRVFQWLVLKEADNEPVPS